jgi:hypothetical protein
MCCPLDVSAFPGFDSESKCTIHNGIASRHIGMPGDIVAEIETSGFKIVRWGVEQDETASELVVEAINPGSSS